MKLYTWTTPNGYKIAIMLEELGVPYEIVPVNLDKKEQFAADSLAVNPNHKIPMLVDDSGITIFESGAIFMYLAERYEKFLSNDTKQRFEAIEWLMYQVANVGPYFGKANHFKRQSEPEAQYALKNFLGEVERAMNVLETRLSQAPYLGGEYGVADMATWPWIRSALGKGQTTLEKYPHVSKWYAGIEAREQVKRALARVDRACGK